MRGTLLRIRKPIETKNPYYYLHEDEDICRKILTEFDLSSDQGHIINGHTPVKEINGENAIKVNGKMIVSDGGFSKAYQSTTGIAGYALLYNSHGMQLWLPINTLIQKKMFYVTEQMFHQ